jgi:predicted LPLAT superfamily acyltransferase
MQTSWLDYRERGSIFAYRLIAQIALRLGRPVARLLLYPICVYYLAFSRTTPRASRRYLSRVFGRAPHLREIYRHHLDFAAVLLDRVFLNSGQYDKFQVTCRSPELLQEVLSNRRGAVMLGAHMGSFELMREFALRYRFIVNMLMYEDNAQKIASVMEGLDTRGQRRIIPIGRLDSLLLAKERLDNGELAGILGDRTVGNDRRVPAAFFGETALFPASPIQAAAALGAPVILFFGLYRGGNRYDVYLERFADPLKINRRKPAELDAWVQRYAARLEHYCRLAPYNWFNFYDFWAAPETPAPPP